MSAETRLVELNLVLPNAQPPLANYAPAVRTGSLLIVSGHLPMRDGALDPHSKGKVGAAVSPEQGRLAARLAAINVLAQARLALGSLDRVTRVVRLGGFVAGAPGFQALPAVMNGASDLMAEVFGDRGRHARTTVGVSELPLDAAVEVEAIFEVE